MHVLQHEAEQGPQPVKIHLLDVDAVDMPRSTRRRESAERFALVVADMLAVGVAMCVVGRALYEGRFTLEAAIDAARC